MSSNHHHIGIERNMRKRWRGSGSGSWRWTARTNIVAPVQRPKKNSGFQYVRVNHSRAQQTTVSAPEPTSHGQLLVLVVRCVRESVVMVMSIVEMGQEIR